MGSAIKSVTGAASGLLGGGGGGGGGGGRSTVVNQQQANPIFDLINSREQQATQMAIANQAANAQSMQAPPVVGQPTPVVEQPMQQGQRPMTEGANMRLSLLLKNLRGG